MASERQPKLVIVPCELAEANAFVRANNRHHPPVVGHKFSLAAADGERVCGVAIVGRPVSRLADDGWTLEVTRLASDGTPNACSALYGACRRATFALGYRRLITYTLDTVTARDMFGWTRRDSRPAQEADATRPISVGRPSVLLSVGR